MSAQAMEALAHANEIRIAGSRWRSKVARQSGVVGRLTLARTLEARRMAPEIGAMRLSRFLTAPTRLGPGKAIAICTEAGIIRRDLRVRDLTLGERARLAAALRRWAQLAKRWQEAR